MAVKVRLRRTGKRKQPSYRMVVVDARASRDGKVIDTLGFYDPKPDPAEVRVDEEKLKYWVSKGAQLSPAVESLLKKRIVPNLNEPEQKK